MNHTLSERGFKQMEPITDSYGGTVRVFESSRAFDPSIWLNVNDSAWYTGDRDDGSSSSHLSLEQAMELRDQLDWLIKNHYQVDREDPLIEGVEKPLISYESIVRNLCPPPAVDVLLKKADSTPAFQRSGLRAIFKEALSREAARIMVNDMLEVEDDTV